MLTKSQSAIEYAILIATIVIAVAGISTYFQRAISARVENARLDLNKSVK